MANRPLDDIDRKILRALVKDARLTVAQLAEEVGLSNSPAWTRLKRLEQDGYIEGYVTVLNQEMLGLPETVIVEIMLDHHDQESLDNFGNRVTEFPEVLEAYVTTGECDYLIKVAVAGTSSYEKFLREKLYRIPGIRHSRSSFALRCLKRMHSVQP